MAQGIETRLVCGFLDAGKTTHIQSCIVNDFFHKYGTTLILAFESGETEYDEDTLLRYRTYVAYWEEGEDVTAFCLRQLEEWQPDRVYVEMNAMREGLRDRLPPALRVSAVSVLIDTKTLALYLNAFRALFLEMVRGAHTVVFRDCSDRALLAPYAQVFRLMNRRAVYLRQDPMGYHERAFDLFVPYDLGADTISVGEGEYLAFYLDACEHPEHYEGKTLRFTCPLELREGKAGLTVMTCCMADIQFMGFPIEGAGDARGWVSMTAKGAVTTGLYRRKQLLLKPTELQPSKAPDSLILKAI